MNWDRKKLEELKTARAAAIKQDWEVFKFAGKEILVDYAKYLIEYLELKLAPDRPPSGPPSPG